MESLDSLLTIMVADMDRAVRFYTEVLGLTLRFRAGNDWAEVRSPGVKIGLHPARPGASQSPGNGGVSLGLEVADIDAAMAELRGRGVEFAGPLIEGGAERIANFADPDGTALYLFQRLQRAGSQG